MSQRVTMPTSSCLRRRWGDLTGCSLTVVDSHPCRSDQIRSSLQPGSSARTPLPFLPWIPLKHRRLLPPQKRSLSEPPRGSRRAPPVALPLLRRRCPSSFLRIRLNICRHLLRLHSSSPTLSWIWTKRTILLTRPRFRCGPFPPRRPGLPWTGTVFTKWPSHPSNCWNSQTCPQQHHQHNQHNQAQQQQHFRPLPHSTPPPVPSIIQGRSSTKPKRLLIASFSPAVVHWIGSDPNVHRVGLETCHGP